ncbi:MAG TPA: pentapeptide repeat-containing protein [Nitrososphaeraceae archaeon]|nr:pentapeptide repeat-containing protein [Nitrososphaeraceae archaeon]
MIKPFKRVDFSKCNFHGKASFIGSNFQSIATFKEANFKGGAYQNAKRIIFRVRQ